MSEMPGDLDVLAKKLIVALDGTDRAGIPVPNSPADLVLASRRHGIVPLIGVHGRPGPDDEHRLARSISYYRDLLAGSGWTTVRGLFLEGEPSNDEVTGPAKKILITHESLDDGSWTDLLPDADVAIADEAFARIVDSLFPASRVLSVRRYVDDKAQNNEALRVELDTEQIALATQPLRSLVHLTGGAGSGKTVVLLARTQWIARSYPDWKILVLCYNNALQVALASQLSNHRNVTVSTFRDMAKSFDVYISERADGADKTARAVARGLAARAGRSEFDAVVIDEAQDFALDWLRLVRSWIVPGHGGLTIASDVSQSLYSFSTSDTLERLTEGESDHITCDLPRSYRTTRQILSAAVAATGAHHTGAETAPDGANIQLIWAPSVPEQSQCIAWEISDLVESKGVALSDIAILYPNRFVLDNNLYSNHLFSALEARNLPCTLIAAGSKAREISGDEITITTFNSAKGKEFSAVFVLAVEKLRVTDPSAGDTSLPTPTRETFDSRAAYVALTRARNTLMLTYTKPNGIVQRLMDLGLADCYSWPADYETE